MIKRGTPPDQVPRQVECRRCQSVLEFLSGDREFFNDPREPNRPYITCPVCKNLIYV